MHQALRMHKVVYWCAGGLLVANCLPHVLPNYSKACCELEGVEAPQQLVTHVKKIAEAMGLNNSDRIEVFISPGHSSLSGGSTRLPKGAIIGLPRAVLFQGPEDVVSSNPILRGEPVAWDSHEGKMLKKILPPSTNVINFRIAHEIAHVQRHDWIWSALLSPVMLVAGYHLAVFVCKFVFAAHVSLAFPVMLSMAVFAYAEINTVLSQWQEYCADRTAALCSSKYAEGGIEFMITCMQLDTVLGSRSNYPLGLDKLMSAFSSHPPYDKRLVRLEKVLSLYDK